MVQPATPEPVVWVFQGELMFTLMERAMGTEVRIMGDGALAAFEEIRRLESILTRFRPSALTQLNANRTLKNPPVELVEALKHALEVAQQTGGLVIPSLLGALEAAGYSRARQQRLPLEPAPTSNPEAWQDIEVNFDQIRLPEGVQLDLGGTAKTWIAEQASGCLRGNFMLDAGGDIVFQQSAPFSVAVEHPGGAKPIYLNLPAGRWGVATSSLLKRAWQGGHHLIDPRTQKPTQSRFVQATALAPTATRAEVLTKLALLDETQLGPEDRVMVFDREHQSFQWNGNAFVPLEETL